MPHDDTSALLQRSNAGDADALAALLARDLPWIRIHVRAHLPPVLRRAGDTDDFVGEAALSVLRHGPRFVLVKREHFRALLAKVVLNILRMRHRELHALKREPDLERPMLSDTQLYLGCRPVREVPSPDRVAQEREEKEWLRLGLLLLDSPDVEVLDLHRQGLSDREVGERLGIAHNAARMRRSRAVDRLTRVVGLLKGGRLDEALAPRTGTEP
ncbi:MAG: ECF-type sigma factor [Planctomycetota bacterium]